MMKPRLLKVRKGPLRLAAIAVLLSVIDACGEKAKDTVMSPGEPLMSAATSAAMPAAPAPMAERSVSGGARDLVSADAATPPPSANQVANSNSAAIVAPTMVIRNGAASIEVDSLEIAVATLQRLASSLGGYVGNTSLTSGAYAVRSAEIQLKIPSIRYDAAVGSLAPIGKVESQTSSAEDVGEEFYDVTARQNNAHKLEERLIALLATRTGKLEDVLAVERELARVREEIERYEGRLRYLKSNVATSTLTVTVHEKKPVVGEYVGENIIAKSFKNAWRIFAEVIAALISALGWIIPLGALAAVAIVVVRKWNTYVNRNRSVSDNANTNSNTSSTTNSSERDIK